MSALWQNLSRTWQPPPVRRLGVQQAFLFGPEGSLRAVHPGGEAVVDALAQVSWAGVPWVDPGSFGAWPSADEASVEPLPTSAGLPAGAGAPWAGRSLGA